MSHRKARRRAFRHLSVFCFFPGRRDGVLRSGSRRNGTILRSLLPQISHQRGSSNFSTSQPLPTTCLCPFPAAVPAQSHCAHHNGADTVTHRPARIVNLLNVSTPTCPYLPLPFSRRQYNINLPLDTLALAGALLEWGHAAEALQYLGWMLRENVVNATGAIDYKNFGCDSDADYGRIIDVFVTAVRYSGDTAWAGAWLPVIHAMASRILALRTVAAAAFPAGSPLHGIVPGSPEHDICGDPGYFFSVNVWHVRGLLSLSELHAEYPALSINATIEHALLPTATAWRADIRFAANFTAVHKTDGSGELYFLHPAVGSAYSLHSAGRLLPGGDESDCVERGTCFASMSAGLPGGGSNQHTNYANFRIFAETLLAGVLDPEYELAIMTFRESHRGTLHGMTRFRDLLDDMPILGCKDRDTLFVRNGPRTSTSRADLGTACTIFKRGRKKTQKHVLLPTGTSTAAHRLAHTLVRSLWSASRLRRRQVFTPARPALLVPQHPGRAHDELPVPRVRNFDFYFYL